MRLIEAMGLAVISLTLAGCGYVHFGRLPAAPVSDAKLAAAYSDLAVEHKILKQELSLARKEGETLRLALERSGAGNSSVDSATLVAQLNSTSRELASLRAKLSELQRAKAKAADAAASSKPATVDAELQAENRRLRTDLERARAENAALTTQLASKQSELAQLQAELRAQKSSRASLAVSPTSGPAPANAPRPTILAALQFAKAPPADSLPPALAPRAAVPRTHVVAQGDTLESIAERYLGSAAGAAAIAAANAELLKGASLLRPGMELQIPEK